MSASYEKAEAFRLGGENGWGEEFVQSLIAGDPSVLGLGDLFVKEKERRQVGAGRLDFLLQSSTEPKPSRYEVEIQLGKTNPSHIIRTIEYWDRERRSTPQYNHIAVIVAEEITARFFNVISLFNQHIPIIAIKMSALSLGEKKTIIFTRVLDHTKQTPFEEDSETPETDRGYWEKTIPAAILAAVDQLLLIAKAINPSIKLRFYKGYIGITVDGQVSNFFYLEPQRTALKLSIRLAQNVEVDSKIKSSGIEVSPYQASYGCYQLRLTLQDIKDKTDFLNSLLKEAYNEGKEEPSSTSTDFA